MFSSVATFGKIAHMRNTKGCDRAFTIGGEADIRSWYLPNDIFRKPKQQARLRGKLKKGERRKAAEEAMRAESVLDRQSNAHHSTRTSSQPSLSVISSDAGIGRHCVPSAATVPRRTRQNPGLHRREPAARKVGSLRRQIFKKLRW